MIVVNLYAGPGSGKSTTCAGVFAKLKLAGVNCEMALEYAKDKVWENSFKVLDNQIYVFGKQLHRLWRLKDQVDVVITDSPLLLSILYDSSKNENFKNLILDQYKSFNNLNYFIIRNDNYNPKGRMQTIEEAKKLDTELSDRKNSHNFAVMEDELDECDLEKSSAIRRAVYTINNKYYELYYVESPYNDFMLWQEPYEVYPVEETITITRYYAKER